jgi:hypothetical protein
VLLIRNIPACLDTISQLITLISAPMGVCVQKIKQQESLLRISDSRDNIPRATNPTPPPAPGRHCPGVLIETGYSYFGVGPVVTSPYRFISGAHGSLPDSC